MGRLLLAAGHASDVGRQRQRNEDSYAFEPATPGSPFAGFALVADGMGGERAGDRASRLAVDRMRQGLLSGAFLPPAGAAPSGEALEKALSVAFREVNRAVLELGRLDPAAHGLGTTLVLAVFADGRVTVAHLGDSRCYRIRGGTIERLTTDHSWVEAQVEAGILTPDDARHHPQRNILIRSLGDPQEGPADVRSEPLRDDDLFLLATDGLTGALEDAALLEMSRRHPDPQGLADALVSAANERDGSDNITVVVVRCRLPRRRWWWPFGRRG